jgi:hypothetical protein
VLAAAIWREFATVAAGTPEDAQDQWARLFESEGGFHI